MASVNQPNQPSGKTLSHKMLKLQPSATLLQQKVTCGLVAESSAIFRTAQRIINGQEPLNKDELVHHSRMYRSVLETNQMRLRQALKQAKGELAQLEKSPADEHLNHEKSAKHLELKQLAESKEMLHRLAILWNLCELIFLDVHSSGQFLAQLLMLIRWHFNSVSDLAKQVVDEYTRPYEHPQYWDLVLRFVLRGDLAVARSLLNLHPQVDSEDIRIVLKLLSSMPQLSSSSNIYEFSQDWQLWSLDAGQTYTQHEFTVEPKLKQLVGLLSGDILVFKQHIDLTESWYHFMAALLLYTDPATKEADYALLTIECMKHYFFGGRQPTTFDNIIASVFTCDLMEVFRQSFDEFDDNWWFVAHFADLLYNGGQLQLHQVINVDKFRQNILSEYASAIMAHERLWTAGVVYFESYGEGGSEQLEAFLEAVPLKDRRNVDNILTIADRLNLSRLHCTVCEIQARQYRNQERYSEALLWAIRSENDMLITSLADHFLQHYVEKHEFLDMDLLGSLGSQMLVSDRLTFLAKYYEFHQLLGDKQVQDACELLISLLGSGIVPNFFRTILVFDTIPLLQLKTCYFRPDQINQIFRSLEDLNNRKLGSANTPDFELYSEKESLLRLSIAQRMTEAL